MADAAKRLLIKNVRLIDPASCYDGIADIAISKARFEKIKKRGIDGADTSDICAPNADALVFDAHGLCAAPGLIDIHCHFRDPGLTHKEDLFTGAAAAKKGGFTTVVLMANTSPVVDNIDTLNTILNKAKTVGINLLTCASVSMGLKGIALTDIKNLSAHGAAGFTDDGAALMDEPLLREAFALCAKLNVPISLHEEDPKYIDGAGINAELCANLPKDTPDFLRAALSGKKGADARAEYTLIERDLVLADSAGAKVVFQHLSTVQSVELIRQYLNGNYANRLIHAEVTPQHFSLTQDAVLVCNTLAKVNPPLRSEKDRRALIEGLKDGVIDIIASDHAPHAANEKHRPFFDAPSGMIGLETSLALGITHLVEKGHLSLSSLIEKMTLNPARVYNLEQGAISEGRPADLVIFDPKKEWIVDVFESKSSNSPFVGMKLKGEVIKTICNGEIVYEKCSS